eukprot:TRINITY_DN8418_c0_g1_i1.p1 TRINITY_DN8418_c0_g1~~TRINITY_DN8418_c0_g1_i1.p1  ORF type:complete len:485 (-),score=93.66 TRINITY_DN8418_c0_g1_i1:102-1556(-)
MADNAWRFRPAAIFIAALLPLQVHAIARRHAARIHSTKVPGGQVYVSELGIGLKSPYVLPIELGGQTLHVVADTGSFGLVMSSKRCLKADCPRRTFDHEESRTYAERGGVKRLEYISGSMLLTEAEDMFSLYGGDGAPQYRKQRFWEVRDIGPRMRHLWEQVEWDGVLGLPWVSTVPGGAASVNETTVTENFGVEAFTLCYGKTTILPNLGGVEITPSFIYWSPLGALRWSAATSYAEVLTSDKHWAVELSDVAAVHRDDEKRRQFACFGGSRCAVLLDSGSGTISLPSSHAVGLMNQLGGEVKLDCSNFEALPDLRLSLGAVELVLPREAYVQRHPLQDGMACVPLFSVADTELADGTPLWILGLPFFRQFVVEFDRKSSPARIGIAPHPGAVGKGGECPKQPELANKDATLAASSQIPRAAATRQQQPSKDVVALSSAAAGLAHPWQSSADTAAVDAFSMGFGCAWPSGENASQPKVCGAYL